jgi:hypothetical protein
MSKNKNVPPTTVALLCLAVGLVIAFGARLYAKSTPVAPGNQIGTFGPIRVMHSDSYWSPFDRCSAAGLTSATDCNQVHVPSIPSSINRAEQGTALNSKPSLQVNRPSADDPQVSEKPNTPGINNNSWNFLHMNGTVKPQLLK